MKPSLEDFLKCKKVRCVKPCGGCLTVGKEYSVLDIRMEIKVKDDEDEDCYWESDRFEPVLEPAENPEQGVELTPEFEAVEPIIVDNRQVNIQDIGTDILDTNADIKDTPKFKVGDRVYYRAYADICVVSDVSDLGEVQIKGWREDYYNSRYFCHATQENYEMLCNLYPHIEFEQPPKPLTGSDLCFEKLRNGKKLVMCAVSDLSDEKAIKRNCIRVIKDCGPAPYHFVDVHGIRHGFAVPLNDETGEPLTQAVLDE